MTIYELTLKGFDGSTDATDHLVKWVDAPSEEAVTFFAKANGLQDFSVEKMTNQNIEFEDGLDVILDGSGLCLFAAEGVDVNIWKNLN